MRLVTLPNFDIVPFNYVPFTLVCVCLKLYKDFHDYDLSTRLWRARLPRIQCKTTCWIGGGVGEKSLHARKSEVNLHLPSLIKPTCLTLYRCPRREQFRKIRRRDDGIFRKTANGNNNNYECESRQLERENIPNAHARMYKCA